MLQRNLLKHFKGKILAEMRHDNVHRALTVIPKWETPAMVSHTSDYANRLSYHVKLSSLSFDSPLEAHRETPDR